MNTDPQDLAEGFDEEMIQGDAFSADHVNVMFPPEHLHGVQFADADVTDESFADRSLQELPEVSEDDIDERDADL